MIAYLLSFKSPADVAVRTAILALAIATLAGAASDTAFSALVPDAYARMNGAAYFVPFSLGLLFGLPIIGFFFSAGLEINRLNERLGRMADEDHLTGLINRRKFMIEIAGSRADGNAELVMRERGAMLIIDADHFKRINDDHGHQAGDEALIHIAQALKKSVRDDDIVARLGGEEFGVFLRQADDMTAFEIAERIRHAVCDTQIRSHGALLHVTVSIGGTEATRAQPLSDCMRNADILLYAAKQAGRNKTLFAGASRVEPFVNVSPLARRQRVNARA